MNKRFISLVLGSLLVAVLLAGCSGKNESAKGGKEMTKIRISAITGISWAPLFVADSEGFFAKEGISVEFITPGGPKGFQAMQAGQCEFAMLSQEPLLIAQEKGMRSTIIATMLKSRVYGIIAPPEITKISALKGKAIYGSDPGSAPYTFTSAILKEAGLNPAKDVSFLQMNADAAIMALGKGEIKAAFINMFKMPELKGMKVNVLVDTTRDADRLKYLGNNEFPAEMLCATEKYVKENPENCQKVINALMNAQLWIQKHTDAEVAASLSKIFTALDKETLAKEVAIMRNVFKPDCFISEEGQAAVVKMGMDAGLISKAIPYAEIVNMSFVKNYGK
ncbi:MAG: ABC transporter substrate-binding protein [Deltaproteobacteria bacterium]|nr:ABC transporter substrate-binding protein [Deltaproteobacteria bacterium]